MNELVFLKLGGSLITDKVHPYTPRLDKLADLATQIALTLSLNPSLHLILGHGSGSFGHTAAKNNHTRDGLTSLLSANESIQNGESKRRKYWLGFAEVWYQAAALNRHVMDALHTAKISSLVFSPLASICTHDGKVSRWDLSQLIDSLEAGLLPVVYGDAVFDQVRGGTILSTEDLFIYLARQLHPKRILLAGLEDGVWADFPEKNHLLNTITPESFISIQNGIGASAGTDVTGGMLVKVEQMLSLVQEIRGLEVNIFSGNKPDAVKNALSGIVTGTVIHC